MARSKKGILFVSAASLAVLALWFFLAQNPHVEVWAKYRQIREGMSENEVSQLFGVPPGNYSAGRVAVCLTGQDEEFAAVDACSTKRVWVFDEGLFEIGFDDNLRLHKKAASANMSRPSVWSRLLHSLGL
ncbi:MAG: hypothetical protein HY040_21035 [Planctomycetes bacterium]|nr:hypothetical protein [Planctomycetota bacterium]